MEIIGTKQKIIGASPFIISVLILLCNWGLILFSWPSASAKHYAALVLVIINTALYFKQYKYAVLLTGAILLLGAFDVLEFFAVNTTYSFTINIANGLTTPSIHLWSLLLLILTGFLNLDMLVNWYLDVKERKNQQ